jgi:hypothetical protein
VSLYLLRAASQGEDLYLNEERYFSGKALTSKAYHSKRPRVAFQRSAPQNTFRRLIACSLPTNCHCFDTISYVPENHSKIDPHLLVALLNSKLLDWYFRLGSTNSKINEYQFNILPCPIFAEELPDVEVELRSRAVEHLKRREFSYVYELLGPLIDVLPFSRVIRDVLIESVKSIVECESQRGIITRSQRSSLSEDAQDYQEMIDNVLYALAGISEREAKLLEQRLATML